MLPCAVSPFRFGCDIFALSGIGFLKNAVILMSVFFGFLSVQLGKLVGQTYAKMSVNYKRY